MTVPRRTYAFDAFRLDPLEKILFHHERAVPLTPKAFETLLALVERHGHLVTKEELFRLVWPDAFVEENNLAQNVSTIRRALGESPGGQRFIATIPKRGYRFVGGVVEEFDDAQGAAAAARTAPPAAEADPGVSAPPPSLGRSQVKLAPRRRITPKAHSSPACSSAFLRQG